MIDGVNDHSWAPLEHEQVVNGLAGAGGERSGDYLSTRGYAPNDKVYAGSCFAYQQEGVGESHYVLFGRQSDFLSTTIFEDGFENGLGAWSSATP